MLQQKAMLLTFDLIATLGVTLFIPKSYCFLNLTWKMKNCLQIEQMKSSIEKMVKDLRKLKAAWKSGGFNSIQETFLGKWEFLMFFIKLKTVKNFVRVTKRRSSPQPCERC
ncbi:CLUMA_CG005872, isoform A [Clunio marinus]|uniref:CLUMA_CG005872, isoform A n=1 Tax=Clunio marinus TaxID=568069 RepID=A0A1J1I0D9_9DIPT|nr:CLUMA_CG005872, isoform A [Clunio marinus]